jgi:ADP-heptose:LPS heptosyltransferase
LNPRKDFHLAALLGCSGLRVGYNRKWGFCLNKKIPDKKAWEIKHEIEYNKDLIKLICSRVDIGSVNLRVDTPESLEFLSREIDLKKKYLVLHPFTSNPAKKLNDLFWNVLQERLASISGMNIVVIGTREEAADYCGPAANLAGKLSLRNLACFLKHHCFCFVGLDSGPMHLASLLNIPAAGLFTISNSRRWAPWSNNVLVEQINNQNDFLSAIARIEKFVAAAKKLIDD